MTRSTSLALCLAISLTGCGRSEPAQVDPAVADPAGEGLGKSAPAVTSAASVAALDKAKLANPCQFDAKAVGEAFGMEFDKTEPETMGDMFGCSYRGSKGTVRLNMMWSDPVYFSKAVETMKAATPGTKRDLAGDPDKAWIQDYPPNLPVLHYYRQNVLVEVVPVIEGGADPKAIEAALLKLPRVP